MRTPIRSSTLIRSGGATEVAIQRGVSARSPGRPWAAGLIGLVAICAAAAAPPAFARQTFQPWLVQVGYPDLIDRLGGIQNTPNGATVGAAMVEVIGNPGGYGPNQNDVELSGKTFFPMSGPPGTSTHATDVSRYYYGKTSSCTPGIFEIWLYETIGWLQPNYLRVGFGSASPPLIPPAKVRLFNNSWVGASDVPAINIEALRRADFAIRRDNTLHISGMNNSGGVYQPLMATGYNGVAVGLANGTHVAGPTPSGLDGPGRQKPEIVAPLTLTSFATPLVSSIAALLIDTAATHPDLVLNPNAAHSTVTKAVLLAGANHRATWSNNPATSGPNRGVTSTPLDPIYGVDVANVNRSHLILTGGEFDGESTFMGLAAPQVPETGWNLASVGSGASRWYSFTLYAPAESLSVVATWHRVVASNFNSFTLANFDLRLWRVDDSGGLQTLVGDAGLPYFASGNVVSQSLIDNVEHLFVRDLQPGRYALELDRIDTPALPVTVSVAWIRPTDPGPPEVFGDLNGDGVVDGADLGLLLANFHSTGPVGDLDGDGFVDGADLGLLLAVWSAG